MRLWSLHPKYLDSRGLVAVWREGLLAQAVLRGDTTGYRNHPQLLRFRERPSPAGAIAEYLRILYLESKSRGYNFDRSKICRLKDSGKLTVTRGQLRYEWDHLLGKVAKRDQVWAVRLESVTFPSAHPFFRAIPGEIEKWERVPGPER